VYFLAKGIQEWTSSECCGGFGKLNSRANIVASDQTFKKKRMRVSPSSSNVVLVGEKGRALEG
jgi:hypothetical protein